MSSLLVIFILMLVLDRDLSCRANEQSTVKLKLMSALNADQLWTEFKLKHQKSYNNFDEEIKRYKIWMQNYNLVQSHNGALGAGKDGFKLGLNSFCDLAQEEISRLKFGLKLPSGEGLAATSTNLSEFRLTVSASTGGNLKSISVSELKNLGVSKSVNWVEKGFVSPVKDQGTCGACWSFVSTSALESQLRINKNIETTLSEQNLIDCSLSYGNEGCDGGLMSQAFSYIRDNRGINPDSIYSYIGSIGKCHYSKAKSVSGAKVTGYVSLPVDEELLKIAVDTIGPIAVGIDADHKSFTLYKSGIYFEPACSSENLNHAVLIVGYGTENGKDYWLIKNSWGKSWGENGFGKLSRNKKNHCGIASLAGYPILA